MEIATHRVPEQRVASTYEQGTCGTTTIHAAKKTLQGHRAVCDGSRIETFVSGRFDPTDQGTCPSCVAALSVAR